MKEWVNDLKLTLYKCKYYLYKHTVSSNFTEQFSMQRHWNVHVNHISIAARLSQLFANRCLLWTSCGLAEKKNELMQPGFLSCLDRVAPRKVYEHQLVYNLWIRPCDRNVWASWRSQSARERQASLAGETTAIWKEWLSLQHIMDFYYIASNIVKDTMENYTNQIK